MAGSIVRHSAVAFVLVLMFALVGAGNVAGATSKNQKPSLTVSAPGSVTNESPWTVSASGYSGQYNTVTESNEKGTSPCPKPGNAFNKKTQRVAKHHKFKVKFSNLQIVEEPQTRTLCVFLYGVGSKYLVKEMRYQIS